MLDLVDVNRDHVLGPPDAELTLAQYGSYGGAPCHAVHEVIEGLRSRFGERMRYVFRHRPIPGSGIARRAAELAELAAQTGERFWEVHDALMRLGSALSDADLARIAAEFELPVDDPAHEPARAAAAARVREDEERARRVAVQATPAFFVNGRRYTGAWDESSLADAMLGSLGVRIQAAAFEFVRWGPSSGVLLGLATLLALGLSNSPLGAAYTALWEQPLGFRVGPYAFEHSLLHWVNHGLLTVFFFVVGLEIKREFTIGHLATFRSGALPVIAAMGGIAIPAVIYATIAPPGLKHGWGIPIGTDTAFAVALIVLLRDRVPIELRVFLTAAVIMDDIVAILVIALFYTGQIHVEYLVAAGAVVALVAVLNRSGVYSAIPYAVFAVVLWFLLHEAGLHATLAAVIMAVLIPALPPANLRALLAQATTVIHEEEERRGEPMRRGPSEPALRALNAINARMESPTDKLLRSVEPWSTYVVLPIFALANAGVVASLDALDGRGRLIAAIALGLVVGKPLGIVLAARLAVLTGLAAKPDAYSWRQLCGAGALGGIGFTMSLFIASVAFPDPADYAAGKIAIFLASLIACALGVAILWARPPAEDEDEDEEVGDAAPA